ncbi:MAG: SAM-dependent methyltransferase, partial [Parasporobacterium sp.]|nr:SAM-dependent methyltransferase [Parasporobacterium sp.]
ARGGGIINEKDARFVARQETTATLEDFIEAAAAMLESRGHLFMIHRPSRLVDIFYYCRKYRLEPKDIRFVAPAKGKAPNMVMVHCVQNGGHELKFADTLYVYDDSGSYSSEICKIYEKTG